MDTLTIPQGRMTPIDIDVISGVVGVEACMHFGEPAQDSGEVRLPAGDVAEFGWIPARPAHVDIWVPARRRVGAPRIEDITAQGDVVTIHRGEG